jgi:hypothetical protein
MVCMCFACIYFLQFSLIVWHFFLYSFLAISTPQIDAA